VTIIFKSINAFAALGVLATFTVADLSIGGNAYALTPAERRAINKDIELLADYLKLKTLVEKAIPKEPPEPPFLIKLFEGKVHVNWSATLGKIAKIVPSEIDVGKWATRAAAGTGIVCLAKGCNSLSARSSTGVGSLDRHIRSPDEPIPVHNYYSDPFGAPLETAVDSPRKP
jgi:hypothetical protein